MLEEETEVLEFRRVDSIALLQKASSPEDVLRAVCSCVGYALCHLSIKPRDLSKDE